MSTPPLNPSPNPPNTKIQSIELIISLALQGLVLIPGIGPGVAAAVKLEQLLQGIFSNALAAHQAEVGQPIDLATLKFEDLVP